ncbi:MAG: SurA N-terminal domain-containing protein [Hyphomicrobiaceae bacterium]
MAMFVCGTLIVLVAWPALATAQGDGNPTASIPGLVVAPPSAPRAQPSGAPGLFVTPPRAPAPVATPQAQPKKASSHRPAKPARSASASSVARGSTSIVALVNDEPITGFNVDQRARFLALSGNIGDRARERMKAIAQDPKTNERLKAILQETITANRGKSREQILAAFEVRKKAFVVSLQRQAVESARASVIPTMRNKALEELIEERLKLQEAKKLSIVIADVDVDRLFKDMAQRNKMTPAEFEAHLERQGASAHVIKARLKASLAWREVVRKRYGHQINVSQREIEDFATRSGAEETQELKLSLITISTPGNPDQRAMAARLSEANAMRSKFRGCKSMPLLAKERANAQFRDLGYKKAGDIAEPTRSLLLSARDDEMLPANLSGDGVELYAVCGRRSVKLDEEKRKAAENQLAMQEFEKLAQRYLYDLRKDALIEKR